MARTPPPSTPPPQGSGNAPPPNPLDPAYIRQQLISTIYGPRGLKPGAAGSGPTDIEYYVAKIIETGGWTDKTAKGENNIGYWTGRITSDLQKSGLGTGTSLTPGTKTGTAPGSTTLGGTQNSRTPTSGGKPPGGVAVPRDSGLPGSDSSSTYAAALQAALMARRRAGGLGRSSTTLGGFANVGAPATAPAGLRPLG